MTYADVLRPSVKRYALLYDFVIILFGSLFIALSSQLAINLPFSPVPITAQTLAVLLMGIILGSRRGGLCLLMYLSAGGIGLPVFANGASGLVYMFGPTGGYLMGFLIAAFVIGWLAERGWDKRIVTTFFAMFIGNVIIYLFGLSWLSFFTGIDKVFALGLYPFVIGDILKIILAIIFLPLGWKLLGKRIKEE